MTGVIGFDDHLSNDHNIWNYLLFINYLREKQEDEMDGLESYVWASLSETIPVLSWVPSRTSYVMETQVSLSSCCGSLE